MERLVKVTVDALGETTPKAPQYAGVQGEHNACRVVFDVTAWANEPFLYRGEFVGGDGAGGTTAVLMPENSCVSFLLPAAWTEAGGRAVARLVASVTVDGEEMQTVYAVDVPLYFSAKQEYGAAARDEAYAGFTALAEAVQEAVETVEEKLASGEFIGPQGEQGKSGVYVGGGEMPEGYNLQIDPEGDASMRLAIGRVETLEAEQTATASITGTADAPILNLGLPRGLPGPQGVTPHIGTNGNWWIGDKDTGVTAEGQHGQTPEIGTNGNWWIGGKDTGVCAQGEPGKDAERPWVRIATNVDMSGVMYELTGLSGYTEICATGSVIMESNAAETGEDGKVTGYTANENIVFNVGRTGYISARQMLKVNHGVEYSFVAQGFIGHGGTVLFDFGIGTDKYSLSLVRGHCALPKTPNTQIASFRMYIRDSSNKTPEEYSFGAGSKIEIWGR